MAPPKLAALIWEKVRGEPNRRRQPPKKARRSPPLDRSGRFCEEAHSKYVAGGFGAFLHSRAPVAGGNFTQDTLSHMTHLQRNINPVLLRKQNAPKAIQLTAKCLQGAFAQ